MADTDPLKRYKSMRDFAVTPEPEGAVAPSKAKLSFVIQKHAATRLHYDFRLELDGTLKSWAVPKGPSFDPADKRMAVHVEDHPLSYGGFEGVIPPKQYGAGTVIVWDRGWWEPVGDPHEGYAKGKLKFRMHGEKLRGGWTLVRMHGRQDDRQEPWLLIKERDETARPSSEFNVVEAMPDSVLSGRSVSEADGPRSLRGGAGREPAARKTTKRASKSARSDDEPEAEPERRPEAQAPATKGRAGSARSTRSAEVEYLPPNTDNNPKHSSGLVALSGSKRSPLPPTLTPQLATLVDAPPAHGDWTYEIKYDGYRILARVDRSDVRLVTRNGNDWTSKLTRLAAAIKSMQLPPSWLDGEIVVLDAKGVPNFGLLQNAFDDASTDRIVYYVFDIPYHAGLDLTQVPLVQRRALLKALVDGASSPKVRYSESFDAPGEEVLAKACRLGLEGIIGKRVDSAYVFRRSPNWVKVKCSQRQEFVIVGFTDPKGSRKGIGALLLGVHDADGKLRYSGKVGTGFDSDTLIELQQLLEPLEIERTALIDKPKEARGHWVKPTQVAEVSFGEWTKDGIVRHPVFHGLRTDKPASAIVREQPKHIDGNGMPDETSEETVAAGTGSDAAKRARKSASKAPAKSASRATASAPASASASSSASASTSATASPAAPKRASTPAKAAGAGTSERLDVHPSLADMRITNPQRVIDPSTGLTKLDLVNYYAHAAPHILPHLARRPVSLVRAPSGIDRQLFFQKHADTLKIPGLLQLDQSIDPDHPPYIEVPSAVALIGAAQMNVIEFHTWNSTTRAIHKPDRMLFDLDPGEGLEWPMMLEAADLVRGFLEELGLKSWLKTSGGKGLHVVVPLVPREDYDTVKDFSRRVVEHIARVVPSRFVAKSGASNRVGKIFIDYLRNGFGATTAVAWSARSRNGLGVSVPVDWSELRSLQAGSQWTIVDAHRRFEAGDRAWADYARSKQTLASAVKKFGDGR